jgi:TatD DNase family protein
MRLVDSHCHLQDERFADDREDVLQRALEALEWLLVVGDDLVSSREAVELAAKHKRVFAAVGIHPHHADNATEDVLQEIEALTQRERVLAWGEIGLDYYYDHSPRPTQRDAFHRQLERACALDLPVIIHSRDAEQDTVETLNASAGRVRGVLHCFSGTAALAEAALELGLYISFSGILTFPKAQEIRDVAAMAPLDRLLVETDAPYLAPHPHRGKRCEPAHVIHTAEALARVRKMPIETLAELTTANAERLFGLLNLTGSNEPKSQGVC